MKFFAYSGALLLLSISILCGAPPEDRFATVREFIREGMVKGRVPSVAIAVAKDGHILWEEGFGWADKEARVPATEHTMYSVASVSKPITATALMTLVRAGRIDLDRPANDYLGAAKLVSRGGDAREATVRRLATHHGGLPRFWNFYSKEDAYPVPSLDETILHYGFIATLPGQEYNYANLGYAILGRIVELVSGDPFHEYVRKQVLIPLGMTRTSFQPGPEFRSFIAARYDREGVRLPDFAVDYPGAAGVYTSAHDLVRFGMFHLKDHLPDQQAILDDRQIDAMQQLPAEGPERVGERGIGWSLETKRGIVEHGGFMPGVSAKLRLVPSANVAVVILTNSNPNDRQPFESEVLDRILRVLDPRWRDPAPREPAPASVPFVADPALVGTWKGILRTYAGDLPLRVEFLPTGEFAHLQLGSQPRTALFSLAYAAGMLDGNFYGDLKTPDADRKWPYMLMLHLKLNQGTLQGTVRTVAPPEFRLGYNLSHWVELEKVAEGPAHRP